jgi:hypothetical protein
MRVGRRFACGAGPAVHLSSDDTPPTSSLHAVTRRIRVIDTASEGFGCCPGDCRVSLKPELNNLHHDAPNGAAAAAAAATAAAAAGCSPRTPGVGPPTPRPQRCIRSCLLRSRGDKAIVATRERRVDAMMTVMAHCAPPSGANVIPLRPWRTGIVTRYLLA